MPIFFLVLGHIFFLSSVGERTKLVVILASFVSLLTEIALPWLIVYHSARWAWLEHPTRITLFGTFLVFVFVPLWEMWTGKTNRSSKRPKTPITSDRCEPPAQTRRTCVRLGSSRRTSRDGRGRAPR